MNISHWIKSIELKELYERHGFRVARVTNSGYCVVMEKDGYFIEIPSGSCDDAYDIKQTLIGLSRVTSTDIEDLFLSHENVIKRIISHSENNKFENNSIIKSTAIAVKTIFYDNGA